MSFLVLDSSALDEKKWSSLLANSPQSTFYHGLEWSLIWETSYDFAKCLFFIEEEGASYRIGLPLVRIKKKGLVSYYSMPMGTYGGPVSSNLTESGLQDFIHKILTRIRSFALSKIEMVDFENSHRSLNKAGFQRDIATTHLLDLKGVEVKRLLNKRGYQQAVKKALGIRKAENPEDIRHCYRLYLATCQRHRNPPKYPSLFYENLFNLGSMAGGLYWWLALEREKIAAYMITFAFKNQVYYWDAASDPGSLNLRPNDLLMGHSVNWAQDNNYEYFNLGSTPAGSEGVARFKEEWGGEIRTYPVYVKKTPLGSLTDLLRRR
jgi:CelD/BcsL family acetyltransferase involved in cellulose biosynthesis